MSDAPELEGFTVVGDYIYCHECGGYQTPIDTTRLCPDCQAKWNYFRDTEGKSEVFSRLRAAVIARGDDK